MFYDRYKVLCDAHGISCNRAALDMGLSNATPSKWKKTGATPDGKTLALVSSYFDVPISYLLGATDDPSDHSKTHWAEAVFPNILPRPKTRKVPRLGAIACGTPILASENLDGYDDVADYIQCDFTLLCKGDSMINARIFNGDIVCIRQQPEVENGEIAAVLIDGEFDGEATLKRVRMFDDHIILEPENPQYRPLSFWGDEMEKVHILGKATHFISAVK